MLLRSKKRPVATIEVAFLDEHSARVSHWVEEADRGASGYHAVLHFLMTYARVLFLLGWGEPGEQLVGWMDEAVAAMAESQGEERLALSQHWRLTDAPGDSRTAWGSTLFELAPGKYKCPLAKPSERLDADAQGLVVLHLQTLADSLPALERAFLALSIAGMHEYHRDGIHWANSKSLHPGPAHGISHARKVLGGRPT